MVNRISNAWKEGSMLNPNLEIDVNQNEAMLRQEREEEMIIIAKRMVKDVVDANAKMSHDEKGEKEDADTTSEDGDTTGETAVNNSAEVHDGDSEKKKGEAISRGSEYYNQDKRYGLTLTVPSKTRLQPTLIYSYAETTNMRVESQAQEKPPATHRQYAHYALSTREH